MTVRTERRQDGSVHLIITGVTILDLDAVASLLDALCLPEEDVRNICRQSLLREDVFVVIQ